MNMNSLVIVADPSRARLFRTAATNLAEVPIELIEVGSLQACEPRVRDPRRETQGAGGEADNGSSETLPGFAHRVAVGAAQFAHDHFCNPFIVVSDQPVSAALLAHSRMRCPMGTSAGSQPTWCNCRRASSCGSWSGEPHSFRCRRERRVPSSSD
jgi:hypothetical protein